MSPWSDWAADDCSGYGSRGGRGAGGRGAGDTRSTRSARAPRKAKMSYPPQLVFVDDLEVWVTRKSVTRVSLGVKPPDGRVELNIPLATPESFIADFVREKHSWIIKQQVRILNSPMSRAESATPAETREWKKAVSAVAPALIAKWELVLGVKAGQIAYRNMKSRWGSCQPSTGRICLNTRLALYPPECLEYVVVHELCHLRVSGHGPEFWALVEACLPGYKQVKKRLK